MKQYTHVRALNDGMIRLRGSRAAGQKRLIDRKEANGRIWDCLPCFAIAALFIAALHAPAVLFTDFFHQEWGLASGTDFWHRAIPESVFALGIITAGKE